MRKHKEGTKKLKAEDVPINSEVELFVLPKDFLNQLGINVQIQADDLTAVPGPSDNTNAVNAENDLKQRSNECIQQIEPGSIRSVEQTDLAPLTSSRLVNVTDNNISSEELRKQNDIDEAYSSDSENKCLSNFEPIELSSDKQATFSSDLQSAIQTNNELSAITTIFQSLDNTKYSEITELSKNIGNNPLEFPVCSNEINHDNESSKNSSQVILFVPINDNANSPPVITEKSFLNEFTEKAITNSLCLEEKDLIQSKFDSLQVLSTSFIRGSSESVDDSLCELPDFVSVDVGDSFEIDCIEDIIHGNNDISTIENQPLTDNKVEATNNLIPTKSVPTIQTVDKNKNQLKRKRIDLRRRKFRKQLNKLASNLKRALDKKEILKGYTTKVCMKPTKVYFNKKIKHKIVQKPFNYVINKSIAETLLDINDKVNSCEDIEPYCDIRVGQLNDNFSDEYLNIELKDFELLRQRLWKCKCQSKQNTAGDDGKETLPPLINNIDNTSNETNSSKRLENVICNIDKKNLETGILKGLLLKEKLPKPIYQSTSSKASYVSNIGLYEESLAKAVPKEKDYQNIDMSHNNEIAIYVSNKDSQNSDNGSHNIIDTTLRQIPKKQSYLNESEKCLGVPHNDLKLFNPEVAKCDLYNISCSYTSVCNSKSTIEYIDKDLHSSSAVQELKPSKEIQSEQFKLDATELTEKKIIERQSYETINELKNQIIFDSDEGNERQGYNNSSDQFNISDHNEQSPIGIAFHGEEQQIVRSKFDFVNIAANKEKPNNTPLLIGMRVKRKRTGLITSTPTSEQSESRVKSQNESTTSEIKSKKNRRDSLSIKENNVKCGACDLVMTDSKWKEHCIKIHNYLAWQEGETPVNINDSKMLTVHLNNVLKIFDTCHFVCQYCNKKYVSCKGFSTHVLKCSSKNDDKDIATLQQVNQTSAAEIENVSPKSLEEIVASVSVKCSACNQNVLGSDWIQHIESKHVYNAWANVEKPTIMVDEIEALNNLKELTKFKKVLHCVHCKFDTNKIKLFLKHYLECCDKSEVDVGKNAGSNQSIECGVCHFKLLKGDWFKHIKEKHNYHAWIQGEPELDWSNTDLLSNHYHKIFSKMDCDYIYCQCGKKQKTVKSFINHVTNCKLRINTSESKIQSVKTPQKNVNKRKRKIEISSSDEEISLSKIKNQNIVKCGVCSQSISECKWYSHLRDVHYFLAWRYDDTRSYNIMDAKDATLLLQKSLVKYENILKCKCGEERFSASGFYMHLKRKHFKDICAISDDKAKDSSVYDSVVIDFYEEPTSGTVKCAGCKDEMESKNWKEHLISEHYNLTWFEGGTPFDIHDRFIALKRLNGVINHFGQLKCKLCSITRCSAVGFYTHYITCGRTAEELNSIKKQCEHCKKLILPINLRAHTLMHMYNSKNKNHNSITIVEDAEQEEVSTNGRRRRKAAIKAEKTFESLEKAENDKELVGSKKLKKQQEDNDFTIENENSGTDEEEYLDDDDNESLISESPSECESDLEAEAKGMIARNESGGGKGGEYFELDFLTSHERILQFNSYWQDMLTNILSKETLFPELRCNKFTLLDDSDIEQYLPPLKESCNVEASFMKMGTQKKFGFFESITDNCIGQMLFVGGPVQCFKWLPTREHLNQKQRTKYMAVITHRDIDINGIQYDSVYIEKTLIQIWGFDNFNDKTKQKMRIHLALGIACDIGRIWSIDWCPSGGHQNVDGGASRLGLLAATSSDGCVYIYAVCNPETMEHCDMPVYKTEPAMILKLYKHSKTNKHFQATAVNWNMSKGHNKIVVGYSDGHVALYDLNTKSPLLKKTENGVVVLYPYYERIVSCFIIDICLAESDGEMLIGVSTRKACHILSVSDALRSVHTVCGSGRSIIRPHMKPLFLTCLEDLFIAVHGNPVGNHLKTVTYQALCVGFRSMHVFSATPGGNLVFFRNGKRRRHQYILHNKAEVVNKKDAKKQIFRTYNQFVDNCNFVLSNKSVNKETLDNWCCPWLEVTSLSICPETNGLLAYSNNLGFIVLTNIE